MKEQIHYDDDRAARRMTVTGWVSRDGRFYGDDEHLARWNGCTQLACACGNLHDKGWTCCEACRKKARTARYQALPFAEWDGGTPLCLFEDDTYFFDADEVLDFCEEQGCTPADLQLVICEPQYARQIEPDEEYSDILPEDQYIADVAPEIAAAFEALNAEIEGYRKPLSWIAGKQRTALKPAQESEAA